MPRLTSHCWPQSEYSLSPAASFLYAFVCLLSHFLSDSSYSLVCTILLLSGAEALSREEWNEGLLPPSSHKMSLSRDLHAIHQLFYSPTLFFSELWKIKKKSMGFVLQKCSLWQGEKLCNKIDLFKYNNTIEQHMSEEGKSSRSATKWDEWSDFH